MEIVCGSLSSEAEAASSRLDRLRGQLLRGRGQDRGLCQQQQLPPDAALIHAQQQLGDRRQQQRRRDDRRVLVQLATLTD